MFSAKTLLYWIVSICSILNCTTSGHILNTDKMIDHRKMLKMDLVTGCQMACLDKFLFDREEVVNPFWNIIDQCMERSKCYMCYDFCEMLNDEPRMIGKLMCTNDTCFTGCKYACVFHKLLPREVLIDF